MVAVVSSNHTGGKFFFYFLKPLMSILYRNVRFGMKTKNLITYKQEGPDHHLFKSCMEVEI